MRFLIDADLPRSVKLLIEQHGHDAIDAREIGLGAAEDPDIAAYARVQRLCLLTGDFDFSDIRNYPPEDYAGIAILELPRHASIASILSLVDEFLRQTDVLPKLEGRLAIVEHGRIRLRPP